MYSRRSDENVDTPLSQSEHMSHQFRLEDTADDRVALFGRTKVQSLPSLRSAQFHAVHADYSQTSRPEG